MYIVYGTPPEGTPFYTEMFVERYSPMSSTVRWP